MKKIFIIISCILFSLSGKSQQDPQYNLYQFNQMVINPAYAGARDAISTIASVRQQWSGFKGAPRTACASAHMPILNKNLGVGISIIKDVLGPRDMTGFYANAAYILKLNSKYKLSFGLAAGYNSFRFDYSKLSFKTTETSTQILDNQSKGVLDINSGLFFRSNTFFAGLSLTHLNRATIYNYASGTANALDYRLRPHAFLTLGKSFKINDNVIFAPTIIVKRVATKGIGNGDLNLNFFLFKKLWLGAFYRGGYGPGFLMQYYITNKFKVAYSYDSGLGDVRRLGAANEVMIGFDFSQAKSKVISPRFL